MKKFDLTGKSMLKEAGNEEYIEGTLPGCNYLDLMKSGKLPDPFWGTNEETAKEVAEKDFEYFRHFTVPADVLEQDYVELVASGLDTLAKVRLNDKMIAETDNAHRIYRFPVKEYLKADDNLLCILFKGTLPYLGEKQKQYSLPSINMGVKGVSYIRKPQYHFGWEWGPVLPPAGVSGHLGLEAYSIARLGEVRLRQEHASKKVILNVHAELAGVQEKGRESLFIILHIEEPGSRVFEKRVPCTGICAEFNLQIEAPQLWWSNGLGNQPLYFIKVLLYKGDTVLDTWEKKIGLRTVELDTSPDKWGHNFKFRVNGVPIFAKGADWIPSDSFVTRTSAEELEFYISSAKEANMNMLRVWGGGYYESDLFYDLCDKYGILVWQDFGFSCLPYPFHEEEFFENVRQEVADNVRRLRHHASLALWCGNNEIELVSGLWKKNKKLYQAELGFFHNVLPGWVEQADTVTPYWPGSPDSGTTDSKPNDLNNGDTHLWQVWHGMLPIKAFRKLPTRFCSGFGMESLPSMQTIRSFTDDSDLDIFKPALLAHQKSGGGNRKMLFYLLSKYRNPAAFEDFIYLSQLIQAETVRYATEQWRRNMGRCNGALYWQYNDCWPAVSWAGIDYGKQFKAVQYRAKYFNQMCCVSAEILNRRADIYVINEYPSAFTGTLKWELVDFHGNTIDSAEEKVNVQENGAGKIKSLSYKNILHGHKKNKAALILNLMDETGILSKQTCLLVPDKKAALEKPDIQSSLTVKGNTAVLTLKTDVFARYVYVDIDGVAAPLSDNYFDIEGGKSYCVTFTVPDDMSENVLKQGIRVHSLTDVKVKGSLLNDKRLRLAMRLNRQNFFSWLKIKFL